MKKFHLNEIVLVQYRGCTWGGLIVSVIQHESGDNYFVESRAGHNKGWYTANYLKRIEDPNNLLKQIL